MPLPPKTKPSVIDRSQYANILNQPFSATGAGVLVDSKASTPYQKHQGVTSFGNTLIEGVPGTPSAVYKSPNNRLLIAHPSGQGWSDVGVYNPQNQASPVSNIPIKAPLPKNNTPNPADVSVLPTQFGTAGTYNPNTGITKDYNGNIIKPIVEQYKDGGLIKKIRGYADGGDIDDTQFKNIENTNPALSGLASSGLNQFIPGAGTTVGIGLQGKDLLTNTLFQIDPTTGKYKNKNQAYGAGLIDAAYKATPLGMAQTLIDPNKSLGEKALSVGTLGISDFFNTKNNVNGIENSNIDLVEQQKQKELQEKTKQAQQDALQKRNNLIGYADGGKITGKGTGTSDSIKAKVKENSFVVPHKNAVEAEIIRKVVLKAPNKKANLNQKGGTDVKLSNGEVLFSPKEVEKVENALGEDALRKLAPNAAAQEELSEDEINEMEMAHGGLTPQKAKTILHEGVANGHKITDKQRRYFGWIAGHKAEGGDVLSYQARKNLPSSSFVFEKERKYPINDETHARNALARVSQFGSAEEKAKVRAAVKAKYPNIEQSKKDGGYVDGGDIEDNATMQKKTNTRPITTKSITPKPKPPVNKVKELHDDKQKLVMQKQILGLADGGPVDGNLANYLKNKSKTSTPKSTYNKPSIASIRTSDRGSSENFRNDVPEVSNAYGSNASGTIQDLSQDKTPASNNGSNAFNGLKLGEIGSAAIDALPFIQTGYGLSQLHKLGKRPIGQLDPDYLKSIQQAQSNLDIANANAKFGFTPEEQAQINNENQNLTNAQRYDARNLSGGSNANAYNMERGAINNAFERALQAKIANRNLIMDKQNIANERQQYLDNLRANKANMARTLFNDKMNAWQQNQQAGAGLLGAGLQNLIGLRNYQDELAAMKKTQGIRDSIYNSI